MTTESQTTSIESQECNAPPAAHENLEGVNLQLDSLPMVRDAVDKAFSYRGDVTIVNGKGEKVEGYIFDRRAESPDQATWCLRLIIKDSTDRLTVAYSDIASINFSGKDPAAGKSFQTWLKKYQEKKAAGETNIRIDPEPL